MHREHILSTKKSMKVLRCVVVGGGGRREAFTGVHAPSLVVAEGLKRACECCDEGERLQGAFTAYLFSSLLHI